MVGAASEPTGPVVKTTKDHFCHRQIASPRREVAIGALGEKFCDPSLGGIGGGAGGKSSGLQNDFALSPPLEPLKETRTHHRETVREKNSQQRVQAR